MAPPHVVVAPLLIALVTAVATLLSRATPRLQRGLSVLGSVAYLGGVAALFLRVRADAAAGDGILVYQLSSWPAPFGISLVADQLTTFMLALAAVVSLAALLFSVLYVEADGQRLSYHALYHFMIVGVSGSFLTGDIFNLFVWFEVMLMSSYVLVVFYGGPEHTRAALHYVVLNLVGSALMLLAIGGLYATTGTLNMADMARRLSEGGAVTVDPVPVLGLAAILFAVFALKAGIVPFQFWVPAAYRAAPAPVAAVLAGVVKKVGIYAIIRLYFTVFAAAELPVAMPIPGVAGDSFLAFFGPILFAMAGASIVLGGVAAVSRDEFDDLLAYSSIGQVGFIVLPLAFAALSVDAGGAEVAGGFGTLPVLGIAAALVYSLNHALAKGALFLTSGAIHTAAGTTNLDDLGALAGRRPYLSTAAFVAGIGLVGIPPLTGFFGKFLVFDTAARAGASIPGLWSAGGLGLALGGAVLTIAYFSHAWNRGFWGTASGPVTGGRVLDRQVAVALGLAVTVVLAGVFFEPVVDAAIGAANAALDRAAYVDAVDPGVFTGGSGGENA